MGGRSHRGAGEGGRGKLTEGTLEVPDEEFYSMTLPELLSLCQLVGLSTHELDTAEKARTALLNDAM